MKKLLTLFFCFYLTGCYFGANESSVQIEKDFYLVGWDERDWIAYSTDDDSIYETEKIIIVHDVFAYGNDDNFIIAKQHPCQNKDKHFMDYDSQKPDKSITNYFIIDTRNNGYKIYRFDNVKDFKDGRTRLGISQSLTYRFYDKEIE